MTDDFTRPDLVQIAETTVAEDCPEEGGDEQACEPGAGAGVIVINQPPDGEVVQVATQDGQRYLLNFPRHLATVRVIDADGASGDFSRWLRPKRRPSCSCQTKPLSRPTS